MSLNPEQLAAVEATLTAPKITPAIIEAAIVKEDYHVFPGTTLTLCLLTLKNGFTVTGESACADPANFKEDVGRTYARKQAIEKLWTPMGYALREKLYLIEQAGAITGKILNLGEVHTYVGTKVVHAVPMSRGDYNELRGWEVPADENPDDLGYLVQYADGGAPNVDGFGGYVSWSPKDVFEGSYTTGVVLKETTFLDRMEKELTELTERCEKLHKFVNSVKFGSLDPISQHDMRQQLTAMENYQWHLQARLKRLSPAN